MHTHIHTFCPLHVHSQHKFEDEHAGTHLAEDVKVPSLHTALPIGTYPFSHSTSHVDPEAIFLSVEVPAQVKEPCSKDCPEVSHISRHWYEPDN